MEKLQALVTALVEGGELGGAALSAAEYYRLDAKMRLRQLEGK